MLTISTWLNALGREQRQEVCPFWPPDLFAIAGALLRRSGGYLRVFEDGSKRSRHDVMTIATEWRERIDRSKKKITVAKLRGLVPESITRSWKALIDSGDIPISDIHGSEELSEHLLHLVLVADEASGGIGIDGGSGDESPFLAIAEALLAVNELHSFCWDIPADVICVLGKQHTPQKGATFRSLSHHLSLYLPNDIEARWINRSGEERGLLNLLLLPWPTRIQTDDFVHVEPARSRERRDTAYFRFRPLVSPSATTFARQLRQAIERARRHAPSIDAVVLPELSITIEQYEVAERIAFEERLILVCGVRLEKRGPSKRDLNLSVIQPAGILRLPGSTKRQSLLRSERLVQAKHHRWHLDRDQLVNYQLSGGLPLRGCWEGIEIPRRILHFVTLRKMTWSVLVCEDLARQDPAADLIRAVGPNLLIALLMDGPQLPGRWPSRYASVLADDPGTSVLTLTSLGMAERCRPIIKATNRRAEASRVIALWRDPSAGEMEITLDKDDDACVLTLENKLIEELSADGRRDGQQTWSPTFAGFKSFRTGAVR